MPEPSRRPNPPEPSRDGRSDFTEALQKGLLLGVALLVLIVPPLHYANKSRTPEPPPQVATVPQAPGAGQDRIAPPPSHAPELRLADFRGEEPGADARLVANWAVATRDHQQHAFVVVDKKDARVYVFAPDGKLLDSAPALLGSAHGDDSFPGIGDKPLALVQPHEKTTPAGRFVAEPGRNTNNEDIVWVDYDAAVSMHRVRPLVAEERRLERLASLAIDDNRISFGCINLPVSFYEGVLSPVVQKYGAIVYVLPDVKTPQQVFGAFDVTDPAQVAAVRAKAQQPVAKPPLQKVALR